MDKTEKKVVEGKDVILLVEEKPMAHATSHSLNSNLELKELLTKDTDGKEKAPGDLDWSLDAEAMVVIDPELKDRQLMDDVFDMHLNKTLVKCIVKSPIAGAMKSYIGNGYITKFANAPKVGENLTYSITITGSGNLKPYTPPEPEPAAKQLQTPKATQPTK